MNMFTYKFWKTSSKFKAEVINYEKISNVKDLC